MRGAKTHVRFTPESGHQTAQKQCPLRANSGHSVDYSTVSPVKDSSDGGTPRPIIAVLRLTRNVRFGHK
jgi:hypothetical protein